MNETNAALSMASASEGTVIVASDACGNTVSLLNSLGVLMAGTVVGQDTKTVMHNRLGQEVSLISDRMIAFAPNDGTKASCLSGYALFARMAVVEFSYENGDVVYEWGQALSHLNPDTMNAAMGWFTGGDEYG